MKIELSTIGYYTSPVPTYSFTVTIDDGHPQNICFEKFNDALFSYALWRREFENELVRKPDIDHCPKCGGYLHDEMGHSCP